MGLKSKYLAKLSIHPNQQFLFWVYKDWDNMNASGSRELLDLCICIYNTWMYIAKWIKSFNYYVIHKGHTQTCVNCFFHAQYFIQNIKSPNTNSVKISFTQNLTFLFISLFNRSFQFPSVSQKRSQWYRT